jgi:hypothetical protein
LKVLPKEFSKLKIFEASTPYPNDETEMDLPQRH